MPLLLTEKGGVWLGRGQGEEDKGRELNVQCCTFQTNRSLTLINYESGRYTQQPSERTTLRCGSYE